MSQDDFGSSYVGDSGLAGGCLWSVMVLILIIGGLKVLKFVFWLLASLH